MGDTATHLRRRTLIRGGSHSQGGWSWDRTGHSGPVDGTLPHRATLLLGSPWGEAVIGAQKAPQIHPRPGTALNEGGLRVFQGNGDICQGAGKSTPGTRGEQGVPAKGDASGKPKGLSPRIDLFMGNRSVKEMKTRVGRSSETDTEAGHMPPDSLGKLVGTRGPRIGPCLPPSVRPGLTVRFLLETSLRPGSSFSAQGTVEAETWSHAHGDELNGGR